jgi:radical SAM superfamily enzyme YgiQ (UPF0313 family)
MSFERILLVKPKGRKGLGFSADVIPIGLEYIASSIEKEVSKVWIIDIEFERCSFQHLLSLYQPDMVGITMSATDHDEGLFLAEIAKKRNITTVVGGYHPTAVPDELLSHSQIDIVVRGEGESTMKELVRKDSLKDILGISYKKSDKIIHNPDRQLADNLDSLPFPARHLRRHKYKDHMDKNGRELDVITMSRGCWGRCSFCCEPYMNKSRMRFRSPENILKELFEIASFHKGKKLKMLVTDPHFIGDPKRIDRLCDLLQEHELDILFSVMTRVDSVVKYPNLVSKMCDSGILSYEMGFESSSQEDLNDIRKGTTPDMQKEAVRLLRDNGANVSGTFVIGLPGQNEELIKQFPVYAKQIGLMNCAFGIATPFPRTEFYEKLNKSGLIFERDWTRYDEMHSVFTLNLLTPEKVEKLQSYCMARFWTLNTLLDGARVLNRRSNAKMSLGNFMRDMVSKAKFARDAGYDLRPHGINDHIEIFMDAIRDAEIEENERGICMHEILEMSTFLKLLGPQFIQLSLAFDEQIVSYVIGTTNKSVEYVRIVHGKRDDPSIGMSFNLDEVTIHSFKVHSLFNPANYASTMKRIEGRRGILNVVRLCFALAVDLSFSCVKERMGGTTESLESSRFGYYFSGKREILGKTPCDSTFGGELEE